MSIEMDSMNKKNIRSQIDIEFEDLTYEVKISRQKDKKSILKGINGTFKCGELTAIMGPSGAGKSSLMNILTGFTKSGVSGHINFGGLKKARKMCCYIMQDDHFYSWCTVEETMMFATSLKISNDSMNMKEKNILIEYILGRLKLLETKSTRCGKLSGGQKKRLSIALELIDNPSILFLDEPTTGLDSSSSYDTIDLLRSLANEKRTVVCTIHQPSSNIYHLFNQIYVLSKGYCTYQGTPANTIEFLKTIHLNCPEYHNPADFLLECVTGEYGDHTMAMKVLATNPKWHCSDDEEENYTEIQLVKLSEVKVKVNVDGTRLSHQKKKSLCTTPTILQKHIYPTPEWIRLWLLIGRCQLQFFRDWTVTYLKLALHITCAILIGMFFGDSGTNAVKQVSNLSSFLVHCIYLWYTTSMPGVLRFPQEIDIIKKETFNSWYKLRTYYLATLITSTPIHIIFSMVYISIAYFMTDQPIEMDRYVKFVLSAIVLTICADGFGILLGTVLNPVNGTFVGAVLTCFMLIYSGFLILLTHMSKIMYLISCLSPLRFGLESMVLSIYSNNRENTICPDDVMYCHFNNSKTILNVFGMENSSYELNILIIVIQLIIFKSLAFITLKRKLYK